jgi:hypothetical protein
MVRLFIRHNVADYQAWRQAYDDFGEQQRALGVKDEAVYQSIDNPNDVTVWHDFETAEEAKAAVGSDELKNAMQNAGVEGEPEIWFVTESP